MEAVCISSKYQVVIPESIRRIIKLLPGKNKIIIRPTALVARKGWDEAFTAMHLAGNDCLLMHDGSDLDTEDWEWK